MVEEKPQQILGCECGSWWSSTAEWSPLALSCRANGTFEGRFNSGVSLGPCELCSEGKWAPVLLTFRLSA